jgi:hypothetical protein
MQNNLTHILKNMNITDINDMGLLDKLLVKKNRQELGNVAGLSVNDKNVLLDLISNHDITLDKLFQLVLKNSNLATAKKISKYYINPIVSEWVVRQAGITAKDIILDGNVVVNSYISQILNRNADIITNLNGFQVSSDIIKLLDSQLPNFNLKNTDLLFSLNINNEINKYDLIFYDIPQSIHNITHASCCENVRKLKIRGTSNEALTLQMISLLLKPTGRAFITLPDSFLYRDTAQIVTTRKYLMEHFNIKSIYRIDTALQPVKDTKTSILYLEGGGPTTCLTFYDLKSVGDSVQPEEVLQVPASVISLNGATMNYSLLKDLSWKRKDELQAVQTDERVETFFNIVENPTEMLVLPALCLIAYKNGVVKMNGAIGDLTDIHMVITLKDTIHPVFLSVLEYILKNKISMISTGKHQSLNCEKINQFVLPYIDPKKYDTIMENINLIQEQVGLQEKLSDNFTKLKSGLIDLMTGASPLTPLSTSCKIIEGEVLPALPASPASISVLYNTQEAGNVYFHSEPVKQVVKSNWYLACTDETKWDVKFIYYYLWFKRSTLNEIATLKSQNHISRSNLLEFGIPNIPLASQTEIQTMCTAYDAAQKQVLYPNIFDVLFN